MTAVTATLTPTTNAPGTGHVDPHDDRLLPPDPGVRALARDLYAGVRDLPILSPHGHVPAQLLLDDEPFRDPTSLLLTPDHYVTRLLHASGVPLDALSLDTDFKRINDPIGSALFSVAVGQPGRASSWNGWDWNRDLYPDPEGFLQFFVEELETPLRALTPSRR